MVSASELVNTWGAAISSSANTPQTTMRPMFQGLKR